MMNVFRARGSVLDLFIKHLENTPCADFLCRLVEMESSTLKVLQVGNYVDGNYLILSNCSGWVKKDFSQSFC
jgi:hypothetical protein